VESPDPARAKNLLRPMKEPFEVTKATDLTDQEILDTWVPLHDGSVEELLHVDSVMPRFLIGGKGGGRTHLMRYSSFVVQRMRTSSTVDEVSRRAFMAATPYLGVYFRCGGLNSNRFGGKGIDVDAWDSIFAYYMDLWLAQLLVETISEFLQLPGEVDFEAERDFVQAVAETLSQSVPMFGEDEDSLAWLGGVLRSEQRTIDREVNNAAITRRVDVSIRSNPGDLVFDSCSAALKAFRDLRGSKIVFLVDEFENLSERQQFYVNTLIREKTLHVNFVVGSRRYGIKTHQTLSAGEINRRGSEYDEIVLEDYYRHNKPQYTAFCRDMVGRRLVESGFEEVGDLKRLFTVPAEPDEFWSLASLRALKGRVGTQRPHLHRFERQLLTSGMTAVRVREVVEAVRIDEHPVVEKFNLLQFYRNWSSSGEPGVDVAHDIAGQGRALLRGNATARNRQSFMHYRADLQAQIQHDVGQPLGYYGITSFILMSGFLPRNLLITLKLITRWAEFQGEQPFEMDNPISLEAQRRGVQEASEWYLKNSRALGVAGENNEAVLRRLGSWLRQMRFVDKPTEVSVCTVSFDRGMLPAKVVEQVDSLVVHNLLIEIQEGQKTKNQENLHSKYQLHPMLAPAFDLPITRRGTMGLSHVEAEVLFDPDSTDAQLRAIGRQRLASLNAPFRGALSDEALF
jgi:hypothetical protein